MADIALGWGADLSLSPDGDLALVDGSEETKQSIIRRLFTPQGGYIWALEYGAGLPERIGKVARANVIKAIVRSQIALEADVAALPVPTITVTEAVSSPGLFAITINYTNAVTGAAIAISLEVPGSR